MGIGKIDNMLKEELKTSISKEGGNNNNSKSLTFYNVSNFEKSKESIWDEFTNLYSLQKTLRFELKPLGKTKEFIEKKGLVEEDEEREKEFNQVKKIMDDYYREFIEICLSEIKIETEDIEALERVYNGLKKDTKNQTLREEYTKYQKDLRAKIYDKIKKIKNFGVLFGKDFINKILPDWLDCKNRQQDKDLVLKFKRWVTYFNGFFKNRKNIFSEKEIPTSIIFRIVHDNMPKFLDNVSRFKEARKLIDFDYKKIEENFKSELNGQSLEEFFSLDNISNCLNQAGIELHNLLIGGKSLEHNLKIKGVNEYIEELSKTLQEKTEQKKIRKLKLSPLFKQILSDRESASFVLEQFKDKNEVFQKIDEFYVHFNNISDKIQSVIAKLKECDVDSVYLKNDNNLTKISQNIFGDWNKIHEGLKEYFILESKSKDLTEKQCIKEVEKKMKSKYFSISEIEGGISLINVEKKQSLIDYFLNFSGVIDNANMNLFEDVKEKYSAFKQIYRNKDGDLKDETSANDVEVIKDFLDSIMNIYHFIKPLHVNFKKSEGDKGTDALDLNADFYNEFDEIFGKLGEIIPLYNRVRNYVTQKHFCTKKFKLNFKSATLASGWDLNKEHDKNYSFIFKEGKSFFLGVINVEEDKNVLREDKHPEIFIKNSSFMKMIYKDLGNINKQISRLGFSEKAKKGVETVGWNPEIKSIKKEFEEFQKSKEKDKSGRSSNFDKDKLFKLIEYYKSVLKNHSEKYEETYNLSYKPTKDYKNLGEFFDDISSQTHKMKFVGIDKNYVNKLIDEGKLYLFQIWNKDFSDFSIRNEMDPNKKSKPNLHTIYWREIFSEENIKDPVHKLNGGAELFFRKASSKRDITHPKNQEIKNKNPINGKEKSTFIYDLIKNERYTEDKFFFYCPVTLNFKVGEKNKVLNRLVNKYIHNTNEEINILGIDRGERNLAYYVLIDSRGNILEQNSFNIISDDLHRKLNYQEKLDFIEGERDKARKTWKNIVNIKEMKTGYLSHAIHKIAKLAIESNAIIVLEDLNFGFQRGRFKIEKQIYQKFEKMLIDKLNYLVFKERNNNQSGGSFKAYQLTNKFDSFKKLGKQSGIIFYVDAYKTSNICPKTGFTNLLFPKFENVDNSRNFFKKFKFIRFKNDEDLFEFNFNLFDFSSENNKSRLLRDNWSVWSNGTKLIKTKDKENNYNWKTKEINVTKELKELFDYNEIKYTSAENIVDQIIRVEDRSFYEKLTELFKRVLQLRNSYTDYEIKEFKKKLGDGFRMSNYDFILSCVKDRKGHFFDSRNAQDHEVKDADANGAYHIALKGLMLIEKIKKSDTNEKLDLKIDRFDFINYAVTRAI